MNDRIVIYILRRLDCNLSLCTCIRYVIGHPYATGPRVSALLRMLFLNPKGVSIRAAALLSI